MLKNKTSFLRRSNNGDSAIAHATTAAGGCPPISRLLRRDGRAASMFKRGRAEVLCLVLLKGGEVSS